MNRAELSEHPVDHRTAGTSERPLSGTEARQASYGRRVLIVLLAGLLMAMLFWIPAEWWGNAISSENETPVTTAPSPSENAVPAQP